MVALEQPAGEDSNWDLLYAARGDEVDACRPCFTGDVFQGVEVYSTQPTPRTRDVMVLQHPCSMRKDGINLVSRVLVAEVKARPRLDPQDWLGHFALMPLPDLMPTAAPTDKKRHQAASFDGLYVADAAQLLPERRVAVLSPRGVNLLMQRWVYHNSRVVVLTSQFSQAIGGAYAECELQEEWCSARADDGVEVVAAAAELLEWLRNDPGDGKTRQRLLEEEQYRSGLRREMRIMLKKLSVSP